MKLKKQKINNIFQFFLYILKDKILEKLENFYVVRYSILFLSIIIWEKNSKIENLNSYNFKCFLHGNRTIYGVDQIYIIMNFHW